MAKQIYYKTCFNRFKSDAKNTWKTINEILSKSKTNTPLPKYFNFINNSNSVENSINDELLKINEWLQINKLSLNIAKSKFMIFQKIDKEMEVLTLKVDNMIIERVKEFNFLGLMLDTNLNWKKHIAKVSNACSQKNGILNKLKHVLSVEIKTLLYIIH